MSRIDYSKWDNLDTDSDTDGEKPTVAPKKTAQPVRVAPAQPQQPPALPPKATAPATAGAPKSSAKPTIACVHVPAGGNWQWFKAHPAPSDHKVFTEGTPSPVGLLVGLPLRIWRLDPRPALSIPLDPALDNQKITYCMIDPFSGFAPPQWQQGCIGDVIVGRADRKPLLPAHFEAFWMFINKLLGNFSSGDEVDPAVEMTPEQFRTFWEDYRESMLDAPARKGEWENAKAPWDV